MEIFLVILLAVVGIVALSLAVKRPRITSSGSCGDDSSWFCDCGSSDSSNSLLHHGDSHSSHSHHGGFDGGGHDGGFDAGVGAHH